MNLEESETGGTDQAFDLHAAADEIISNDSQEAASSSNSEVEGDKQNASQENSTEAKGPSLDEMLGKLGEEKADPKASEDLLKFVNDLGVTRNGLPVKVENSDQLKELISKGYDYTQKTMEHSDQVKAKEAEFQAKETEFTQKYEQLQKTEASLAETTYENNIMTAVLEEMKQTDPDLFEEIRLRYTGEQTRRSQAMPYVKQFETKFEELNGKIQSLQTEKHQEELKSIKQGWEKELATTQSKLAPLITKLGIKPDYAKVQKIWANDATGEMTVEQAFQAAHGAELAKAYESHQKLLATKNKTNNSMLKRTGIGGNAGGSEPTLKIKTGDYGSFLQAASKTME